MVYSVALKAEVWVETITEDGRSFMAAWRKEEVDAARHRQEKREATRLGNLLSHTEATALKAEVWVETSRRVSGGSWPRGEKKR